MYRLSEENRLKSISKISIGSCYNGRDPINSRYDIFETISRHNPDLFIWLGDAAYIRPTNIIGRKMALYNCIFGIKQDFNYTLVEGKFNLTKFNKCK